MFFAFFAEKNGKEVSVRLDPQQGPLPPPSRPHQPSNHLTAFRKSSWMNFPVEVMVCLKLIQMSAKFLKPSCTKRTNSDVLGWFAGGWTGLLSPHFTWEAKETKSFGKSKNTYPINMIFSLTHVAHTCLIVKMLFREHGGNSLFHGDPLLRPF